jgi:hypothetical protein
MKKFKTITFEIDLMIDDENSDGLNKINNKIINKFNSYTKRIINCYNFNKKNKIIIKRVVNKTFPLN